MAYQNFDDLDSYMATLKEKGITKVVVRHIKEKRPEIIDAKVTVHSVMRVNLLAYEKGVIYQVQLDDTHHVPIDVTLRRAGFTTEKRNGNIT